VAGQALGKAAARWGYAQAVTFCRPISKSSLGEMRWKLKVMGGGGRKRRAQAGWRAAEAAYEAADGGMRWRRRAKRYGEGQMPCMSATTQQSIAVVEKGQEVWPGTGARRSEMWSTGGRSCRGEPSGATSVLRGQEERN
jgi:hypothetical protein